MYTDDELSDHSEDERMYEEWLVETDGGNVELDSDDLEAFKDDPPAHVIDGLSFGNWYHADKSEHAFDVVYSIGFPVGAEEKYETEPERYLFFDIGDTLEEDLGKHLDDILPRINKAIAAGRRVYVHCHLGQSRSTTIVIAYLVRYHDMTPRGALTFLQGKRATAEPNNSFRRQLNAYYRRCQNHE